MFEVWIFKHLLCVSWYHEFKEKTRVLSTAYRSNHELCKIHQHPMQSNEVILIQMRKGPSPTCIHPASKNYPALYAAFFCMQYEIIRFRAFIKEDREHKHILLLSAFMTWPWCRKLCRTVCVFLWIMMWTWYARKGESVYAIVSCWASTGY